jgi:hypothetical protein
MRRRRGFSKATTAATGGARREPLQDGGTERIRAGMGLGGRGEAVDARNRGGAHRRGRIDGGRSWGRKEVAAAMVEMGKMRLGLGEAVNGLKRRSGAREWVGFRLLGASPASEARDVASRSSFCSPNRRGREKREEEGADRREPGRGKKSKNVGSSSILKKSNFPSFKNY